MLFADGVLSARPCSWGVNRQYSHATGQPAWNGVDAQEPVAVVDRRRRFVSLEGAEAAERDTRSPVIGSLAAFHETEVKSRIRSRHRGHVGHDPCGPSIRTLSPLLARPFSTMRANRRAPRGPGTPPRRERRDEFEWSRGPVRATARPWHRSILRRVPSKDTKRAEAGAASAARCFLTGTRVSLLGVHDRRATRGAAHRA